MLVEPGVLLTVLKFLKEKSESMSEYERVCVMSFDRLMSAALRRNGVMTKEQTHSMTLKVKSSV